MARLLLVDDDPIFRTMVKDALLKSKEKLYDSTWALTVWEVPGAIEALDNMKVYNYELIITDILMARMNGWDFIKEVRKTKSASELPIIVVSALDGVELEYQAIRAGANSWFTKPIHPVDFSKQVFTFIQER